MSEIKGQYYTTDNNHFVSVKGATPADDKMKMIKINNQYVLIILSRIFKDENFAESAVIKKYMPSILAGNLARPDNNTGFNSKKLGDKIKFIVRTLANKENVAERQKFLNSPFVKCFLEPFTYGGFSTLSELDDKWVNYTNLGRIEKQKERDALNGALGC